VKTVIIFVGVLLLLSIPIVAKDNRAGEEINWQVLSNGGGEMSSTNYNIQGTLCQTAVTVMSSANHNIHSGFWQTTESGPGDCVGLCGDANGDDGVNVSDVVYLLNYIFTEGPGPQPILACGDANTDGGVNISDAYYIINYVFLAGAAPVDCSQGSGWITGDCCEFVPATR